MQHLTNFSLKLRLAIAMIAMLVTVCAVLVTLSARQTMDAMLDDVQNRQDTSLRVIASVFQSAYDDLTVTYGTNGQISRAAWTNLPDFDNHTLIDQVGRVSGEVATVFVWDVAENDYRRMTTNIVKPDGDRAVGTYLGRDNPVYVAIRQGQTYRGEAVILGKPYLTAYLPVYDNANDVIGILFVGVERTVVDIAIRDRLLTMLIASTVVIGVGALTIIVLSVRLTRP
ncbi:Cache 3/Cache 2 fusion domain-containing protein, partial [Yoonia sp.]|uniref:Cache 3/Cache 2 fusion domain-containing protein n=1 Tax=Yoonia sp. TaxID=2212373 RepID=UPI003A4DC10C